MSRKAHLGILCDFGWQSIRSFIYSGLLETLKNNYNITVFAYRYKSDSYSEVPEGVNIVPYPFAKEKAILRKWRSLAAIIHESWMNNLGTKKWLHSYVRHDRQIKWFWRSFSKLISNDDINNLFYKTESKLAQALGTNHIWAQVISELGIDAIIAVYFGERTLVPLQTAYNLGKKTIIIPIYSKSIFSKPHFHLIPSRIFLWNERAVEDYNRINPWIDPKCIKVTGSLLLEPFKNTNNILGKRTFCEQVGLDPERPYICYTAASPKAVKNEKIIITEILQRFIKLYPNLQLLLRLNPEEDGDWFVELENKFNKNLIVHKPQWERYLNDGWRCPLPEDIVLWIATIKYSLANISIPSTVTLEYAAMRKPVINICFDMLHHLPLELSNRRFWNAEFYSEARELRVVTAAFSLDQLIDKVIELIEQDNGNKNGAEGDISNQQEWLSISAIKEITRNIDELFS